MDPTIYDPELCVVNFGSACKLPIYEIRQRVEAHLRTAVPEVKLGRWCGHGLNSHVFTAGEDRAVKITSCEAEVEGAKYMMEHWMECFVKIFDIIRVPPRTCKRPQLTAVFMERLHPTSLERRRTFEGICATTLTEMWGELGCYQETVSIRDVQLVDDGPHNVFWSLARKRWVWSDLQVDYTPLDI